MQAAAEELKKAGAVPFAGYVTDPCDGRTQGTTGMFDSLAYRNDAAIVFRRLIRSLPTRRGVIGVATCDKGLPAMMIALAATAQSALRSGARGRHTDGGGCRRCRTCANHRCTICSWTDFAPAGSRHGMQGMWIARRRMSVSWYGCHRAGGRGSSGNVADPLGTGAFRPPHLARHGPPVRTAVLKLESRGLTMKDILTDDALTTRW